MPPLRRIAATSRWALLALVLSAPIALVPYVLHSPGLDGAIGLPGVSEFAGAVRAALPQAPERPSVAPVRRRATPQAPTAAAVPHTSVAAHRSGRHLQSVVTASCAGCTVVKDSSSGALRATVSRSSGPHAGSAYAVVDMGAQRATLAVQDRLALGTGQVPTHDVDVLQVTDAHNRVVYRLVVAARTRLLSFVSPPGALSAQGVSASTGQRVPNDGHASLDVRVVTRTNGFVTVGVNGSTVLARTGLSGGAAAEQRYVAAGILHADQAQASLTVVHAELVVKATTPEAPSQPVAVAAASLPIASRPAPPPPANVGAPSIAGTPYDGATLTVQTGTWTGADSLAVRWSRCAADGTGCTAIDGATGPSYTPDTGDVGSVLRATVTASNAQGSAPASTALTDVVAGASPVNLTPPTIGGTAMQGRALRYVPGTWRWKTGNSTYRWQRCDSSGTSCAPVNTAQSSSYSPTADDVGSTFRLVATAPGYVGTTSVTTAATVVVAPAVPVSSAAPTVSGSAVVGSKLTVDSGTWSDPQPELSYAWSRCAADGTSCTAIPDATGATYAVTAADVGSALVASVAGANTTGSTTAASAPTRVVPSPPAASPGPSISGDLVDGSTLTADLGTWSDPTAALSVAWLRCDATGACAPIDGAVAGTYTLTDADVGATIAVVVTATGDTGTAAATSAATGAVGPTPPPPPPPAPPAATTLPTITGDPVAGSTLTADLGVWSDPAAALSVAWLRCDATGACAPIDGAVAGTYTLTDADVGDTIEVVVTATGATGTGTATSAATGAVGPTPPPPPPPAPAAPGDVNAPAIQGEATVGSTLTADPGTWSDPAATLALAWERCDAAGTTCVPIAGATGSTYVVTADDLGSTLELAVTATNAGGSGNAASAPSPVVSEPVPTGSETDSDGDTDGD